MIGICIPAHNEERYINLCLASVMKAANCEALAKETVLTVVVHDACTDGTALYTQAWPVINLSVAYHNVGLARAAGARYLIQAGARWLAFTDADTVVSEAWLFHQLSLRAQVVCGTVEVSDWSCHGDQAELARNSFLAQYTDADGHRHVHGANLGIDATVYEQIGGFEALACSEDQALVDKLVHSGASIAWTALPRVTTSARPFSRIEGGFATTLRRAYR
ncbi:glycosyltransferase [Paenalcaligenes niemegkensis]|uniref:glycosyltransferase n=1 Tax=Paenalcaligenes niemegkensis TaxID=2895469 RepID=UPI001EE7DB00|nr:glycosyltransferase [Paenalcaligenes niemegkensis]MCQ9615707.1 glycosyltransferase [Paenalcaligenes niemegkensis]